MLKASSLFYALSISVLIALISSAVLSCAYFSQLCTQRDSSIEEVQRNSRSGINLLLGDVITDFSVPVEKDLFNKGGDSVRLQKKQWGIFEVNISKAHHGKFNSEMIAMSGCVDNDHAALILADLDRPLSVCGNTKLVGDCFLPKAGIQRAYIEGQNFTGDKLVDGEIKIADRFLPGLNKQVLASVKKLLDFTPAENFIGGEEFQNTDTLLNSFSGEPIAVFSPGEIVINAQIIRGQILIVSKKSIRVTKNALLENIILAAPYIQIDEEVKGRFQAFSSDSLIIGKNCRLSYPSVLGLLAGEKSPALAPLLLGENASCCGEIFAVSDSKNVLHHVRVSAEKDSKVYGEIFSADLAELKGTVYGKVTCAKLELKTASAVYENHLLNTTIDRSKRITGFLSGFLVAPAETQKEILQWLE
jgi:hypothetical protein